MKYSVLLGLLLVISSLFADEIVKVADTTVVQQTNAEILAQAEAERDERLASLAAEKAAAEKEEEEKILKQNQLIHISVVGQGVAPMNTSSPAQAYALAKRAAIADAYRAIAEKVKGVRIDGQDTIKNMMVQRSTIRTYVQAMVRNASIVETTFKEGLCEVEMEVVIAHSDFAQ